MSEGFAMVPLSMISADVGHRAFRVLVAILAHCDRDGACFPSNNRLADVTGLARRNVIAALAELEQAGFIAVDRDSRPHSIRLVRGPSPAPAGVKATPRTSVTTTPDSVRATPTVSVALTPGVVSGDVRASVKNGAPLREQTREQTNQQTRGGVGEISPPRKNPEEAPAAASSHALPGWTDERRAALPGLIRARLRKVVKDDATARDLAGKILGADDELIPDLAELAIGYVGMRVDRGDAVKSSLFGWIRTMHDQWFKADGGAVPEDVRRQVDRYFRPTNVPAQYTPRRPGGYRFTPELGAAR